MSFTSSLFVLCFLAMVALNLSQVDDEDTFSLYMTGLCSDTHCRLKGNSQSIQTIISDDDGVTFSISPRLGSYALLFILAEVNDGVMTGKGNMTFGIHNAREHTIFFEVSGPVSEEGSMWGWTSLAGFVTSGQGVFSGYTGIMTVAGTTNGTYALGLVSGHIWKPDTQ